jgi:phosphomannomutase
MAKTLTFGTSGLRDTVENMTDRECYINTLGFISFLKERGEIKGGKSSIALAGDRRNSTPRIMAAVAKAIEDAGLAVMCCGKAPTPTLCYFAINKGVPSVMVTGSHIPDDRNGIKFTKTSGEVLKSDEGDILRNVAAEREKGCPAGLFDDKGMFVLKLEEPQALYEREAADLYIKRYIDFFPANALGGRKIVFYQHSAVGRDMIVSILKGLGAEVVTVGRSEKFVPVDTEKVAKGTVENLKKWALEYRPFALVSTDGDSDRPLLADENGDFLPGDKLGALVSIFLKPDFVAIPISANDAVVAALKKEGVKVAQTRIGSPYVVKAMADELASNPSSKVVSWESNGGFLLGSAWKAHGKCLTALPTRDAVLPILGVLLLASERKTPVSALIESELPHRYTDAGVIDDHTPGCEEYTTEVGKTIIKEFSPKKMSVMEADFTEEGVKIGGKKADLDSQKEMTEIKEKLSRYFNESGGFNSVKSINFTDGIRVEFDGGDVAHMRPSGNAPEFRLYATAETRQRASRIVEQRNKVLPLMIRDMARKAPISLGACAPFPKDPSQKIFDAAKKGTPFYIRPHQEPKVWGVKGIGEYWYGAEAGDKSSVALFGDDECPFCDVVARCAEDILGEKVIKKFGQMVPLVKVLTPRGRLSVQFHDSKNELWIVTNTKKELAGGIPRIIVGFSRTSVEKYGKGVIKEYGQALVEFGAKLNALLDELEGGEDGYRQMLLQTRDVIKAAEYLENGNKEISRMLAELLFARGRMETFYNYREVKPGDVIPIPAGTLHALGAGVEVVEPQIPGPTQSLEDGAVFPVRYYFPGHERPGALKKLDVDRIGEMHAGVTPEAVSEVIEEGSGYTVERLPGKFEDKGLEVRRINAQGPIEISFKGNSSLHNFVAVEGEAAVISGGRQYPIPLAKAGGEMLIIPASCREYAVSIEKASSIIDTFTPS